MYICKTYFPHPSMRAGLPLLLITILALFTPASFADELIMKDGSRLLGEVIKREGGTLEFKTSYAGVIQVNWDEVDTLVSEKPMTIMLEDKSTTQTKRITNNDDQLIVEHDAEMEPEVLEQEEVAFINPEPWQTGDGYKLTGRVNFAFQRERGNTDTDENDLDADLLWRSVHDRFKMFGEFERDRNNNNKTKDKWKQSNAYHHFFSKKWYGGALLGFEYDKFADLDLRTSVGPVAGYQWFESPEMNLSTEIAPLYVDEQFNQAEDDDYYALGWGINFDRFVFGDFVQVYHKQVGKWDIEDTSNVIWDTWTGLRFPLVLGVVVSTEMKVQYNSGAPENTKKTDTTYSLKLGYQW